MRKWGLKGKGRAAAQSRSFGGVVWRQQKRSGRATLHAERRGAPWGTAAGERGQQVRAGRGAAPDEAERRCARSPPRRRSLRLCVLQLGLEVGEVRLGALELFTQAVRLGVGGVRGAEGWGGAAWSGRWVGAPRVRRSA
jgi:hypothetical protein